jgi:hypothetical protein
VCVRKGPTLKVIRLALSYIYHFGAIPHFRELFDCPTYANTSTNENNNNNKIQTRNFKFKTIFIITADRIQTLILWARIRTWCTSTLTPFTQPPFKCIFTILANYNLLKISSFCSNFAPHISMLGTLIHRENVFHPKFISENICKFLLTHSVHLI